MKINTVNDTQDRSLRGFVEGTVLRSKGTIGSDKRVNPSKKRGNDNLKFLRFSKGKRQGY